VAVKLPVPPPLDTVRLIEPLVPLHVEFVGVALALAVTAGGTAITADAVAVAVQLFASVTVTVTLYVPAPRPAGSSTLAWLAGAIAPPFLVHKYEFVFAPVPPPLVTVRLIEPVPVLHNGLVGTAEALAVTAEGAVITAEAVAVAVHDPLPTVTVTLYVPAPRPAGSSTVAWLAGTIAPPFLVHAYVGVPSLVVTVRLIEPVPVLHNGLVGTADALAVICVGFVNTADAVAVAVQLLASVTVTVTLYVPALKPVGSSTLAWLAGIIAPPFLVHTYEFVFAPVPPPFVTVRLIEPSEAPKQEGLVGTAEALAVTAGGTVISADAVAVAVQLLASVTVTVTLYVPAPRPAGSSTLAWLAGAIAPLFLVHEYVMEYGGVPPEAPAVRLIEPVPVLHNGFVAVADAVAVIALGAVRTADVVAVAVHEFASLTVTVTLYVPAPSPAGSSTAA
jgi:hypothetical protein